MSCRKAKDCTFHFDHALVLPKSSTSHANNTRHSLLTVKGAPDILLERCTTFVRADGNVEALDEEVTAAIRKIKDDWSSQGKRVILLARKIVQPDAIASSNPSDDEMESRMMKELRGELVFVGLLALIDPPRSEIPEVMKTLRGAGIRAFMVSPSRSPRANQY